LRSVTTDSERKEYRYNYQDSSLRMIKYDGGLTYLFDYNEMGHISGRRYVIGTKEIVRQVYSHTPGGMLRVTSIPDDDNYGMVYSENGQVIAVNRAGYFPDKTVSTKDTHINLDGDLVS